MEVSLSPRHPPDLFFFSLFFPFLLKKNWISVVRLPRLLHALRLRDAFCGLRPRPFLQEHLYPGLARRLRVGYRVLPGELGVFLVFLFLFFLFCFKRFGFFFFPRSFFSLSLPHSPAR